PDECITEMEEAAFKEIEFGLEKEEDNEEEVAGAEESEADHSIPGIVRISHFVILLCALPFLIR
ncbi:hypothetical protein BaRGS_00000947, partial [Batillaria attramentaria]